MDDNEFKITLKKLARTNRNNMTEAESLIWNTVLKEKRTGYKFLRQKRKLRFILDFYCSELKLAIEIDGNSHDNKENYDLERDGLLEKLNIRTIRYSNGQVFTNLENVFNDIKKQLLKREKEMTKK